MELNLKDRKKLTQVTAKNYQKAKKSVKSKILDTFISQTGYERKYAIHLLANEGSVKFIGKNLKAKASQKSRKKRVYARIYDDAVRDALLPIWLAFNCLCGKILAPFLHANVDRIASSPHFALPTAVREKLSRISAATIDRLLRTAKRKMRIKGTGGTRPAAGHIKNLIPLMSHFECKEHGAGLWHIDLVQHDGGCPEGEFCYTLTVTELATCGTAHYALKNKAFTWVFQALNTARSLLPLPVRILHSDNGSEFINHALTRWCQQQSIELTRSRSDKKNDNCWVEQKNYASVRKIVGYGRYSGEKVLPPWMPCMARMTTCSIISTPARSYVQRNGPVPKSRNPTTSLRPPLTGRSPVPAFPTRSKIPFTPERPLLILWRRWSICKGLLTNYQAWPILSLRLFQKEG